MKKEKYNLEYAKVVSLEKQNGSYNVNLKFEDYIASRFKKSKENK